MHKNIGPQTVLVANKDIQIKWKHLADFYHRVGIQNDTLL